MNGFQEGDILVGKKRDFIEAYHPIIYIAGPDTAPFAVILTHSGNFPCNIKLWGNYGTQASYFVAHLIEKASEWGPYEKIGELNKEDLDMVKRCIYSHTPITWAVYEEYTRSGCPDHK